MSGKSRPRSLHRVLRLELNRSLRRKEIIRARLRIIRNIGTSLQPVAHPAGDRPYHFIWFRHLRDPASILDPKRRINR